MRRIRRILHPPDFSGASRPAFDRALAFAKLVAQAKKAGLIHFARRMIVDTQFDPGDVRDLLGVAR